MINALIRKEFVPAKYLSLCNWNSILSKCNELGIDEISKFDLVFKAFDDADIIDVDLFLVESKQNPYQDQRGGYYQIIHLDVLKKQHINSFLNLGVPKKNIISINQGIKEVG